MSASESQEGVRGDHLYEGGQVCGFVFCVVGSACYVEELVGGGWWWLWVVACSISRPKNEAVYRKEHCAESQVGSGYSLVLPLTQLCDLGQVTLLLRASSPL